MLYAVEPPLRVTTPFNIAGNQINHRRITAIEDIICLTVANPTYQYDPPRRRFADGAWINRAWLCVCAECGSPAFGIKCCHPIRREANREFRRIVTRQPANGIRITLIHGLPEAYNGRCLRHRPERSGRCLNYGNCTNVSPRSQTRKVCRRPSVKTCLLYTSPSPRDQRGSRMPSSA